MIFLLLLAGFFVTWVGVARHLYQNDSYYDGVDAVMLGGAVALVWPLSLVAMFVHHIVVSGGKA